MHRFESLPARIPSVWNFGRNRSVSDVWAPRDTRELASLLAARNGRGVAVVGCAGSWTPVFVARGDHDLTLDLSRMAGSVRLDPVRREVTVSGWTRARRLHADLAALGFELTHIPTWADATVAGLCATGSHGASRDSEGIADAVVALDLLDADGRRLRLDADGLRDVDGGRWLLRGADYLRHGAVHLGAFGIVTAVTLRVAPLRFLAQSQTLHAAGELLTGGLVRHLESHEHASVAWGIRQGRCVARAADTVAEASEFAVSAFEEWFTKIAPTALMRAISAMPWLADRVNDALLHRCFLRRRVAGPAWAIQTYMPARLAPAARLRTMEYAVPLDRLDEVVGLYASHLAGSPSQLPLNFRRAGSRVFVEHLWCDGFPGAEARARAIEQDLVDRLGGDALPHPAKLHWISPWPRFSEARRAAFSALAAAADPAGVFESRYLAWLRGRAGVAD